MTYINGASALVSFNDDPPLPAASIDELEACFVVIDSAGQKRACVYFEDEPGRRSAAKLLSEDEAAHRGQYRQVAEPVAEDFQTRRRTRKVATNRSKINEHS